MSNNQFTALHQTALSPLCLIPSDPADSSWRSLAARDTLDRAEQALESLYQNASNEDYGRVLMLETVHGAIKHAIALLSIPEPTAA